MKLRLRMNYHSMCAKFWLVFGYRKILRISYKDYVTNDKVRAKIQQAIGPHEDLLTTVKRHKLQWYGHVSR